MAAALVACFAKKLPAPAAPEPLGVSLRFIREFDVIRGCFISRVHAYVGIGDTIGDTLSVRMPPRFIPATIPVRWNDIHVKTPWRFTAQGQAAKRADELAIVLKWPPLPRYVTITPDWPAERIPLGRKIGDTINVNEVAKVSR